jgi:hypothetical protein
MTSLPVTGPSACALMKVRGMRKSHHELVMKEFDDKLNGLIAWLDDFVKRNPRNGK